MGVINRLRGDGERGSLPAAMLAVLVVSGLVTVMVSAVLVGQRNTRFDRSFEQSLQVADGGLERAVTLIQSRARSTSFTLTDIPGETVTATLQSTGRWVVTSTALTGAVARDLRVEINAGSLFTTAAFGDLFVTMRGGNSANSYRSGSWAGGVYTQTCTVPATCQTNHGTVGTNGDMQLGGQTQNNVDLVTINYAQAPESGTALTGATGTCSPPTDCSAANVDRLAERVTLPAVNPPCTATGPFPGTGPNVLPAGNLCYTNVTLTSGTVIDGTPSAPTRLYITGNLNVPNGNNINFANALPRPPAGLLIFSSGTGPAIDFGNHVEIAAAVYAPTAGFSGGAQGKVYGSLVVGNISSNGGWDFFWDEALSEVIEGASYGTANWSEE